MKYVGSKARLSKYIVPILQRELYKGGYSAYVEPFVGGANIIQDIDHFRKIGIDNSLPLIQLLRHVADGGNLPESVSKDLYDLVRKAESKGTITLLTGICGYLASYNGKYFGGYAGTVHTKAGTVRNYYDEARRNLLKQAEKLKGVEFICDDYRNMEMYTPLVGKLLIYADPPYKGTTGYSTDFDTAEFWQTVREWSDSGHTVIVSELEAPDDFTCLATIPVTRTLNHGDRAKVTEKLFIRKG